jgi:hypothetical protein
MSDVLKMIKELEDRLFVSYGDPLANYKETQHDIHMTYYVGRLMEERGHEYITPKDKDCVYYSEKAIHDAFLAGQLLARMDARELRKRIVEELKAEMHEAIDNM